MRSAISNPVLVNRLAARGTLRLALKQGGLAPSSVIGSELAVVVRPILPDELSLRGVADAGPVCDRMTAGLESLEDSPTADTPEVVFSRLGGGK